MRPNEYRTLVMGKLLLGHYTSPAVAVKEIFSAAFLTFVRRFPIMAGK
jgi:hypothetical protein